MTAEARTLQDTAFINNFTCYQKNGEVIQIAPTASYSCGKSCSCSTLFEMCCGPQRVRSGKVAFEINPSNDEALIQARPREERVFPPSPVVVLFRILVKIQSKVHRLSRTQLHQSVFHHLPFRCRCCKRGIHHYQRSLHPFTFTFLFTALLIDPLLLVGNFQSSGLQSASKRAPNVELIRNEALGRD